MAKILRAVKPNAGIRAKYRKQLRRLVKEMEASAIWWVRAAYRRDEEAIAQDAGPAGRMGRLVNRLFRYWLRRFQSRAEKIARDFVNSTEEKARSSYREAFKAAGYTVKMKPGRVTNNVVAALIQENVNLIVGVPRKFFGDLQGVVQRAIINGRDVGYLVEEIQARSGKTLRQADNIARDQANKALQAINRVESESLGIKVGIWVHRPGRYYVRHTHKAMNGKPFLLSEGMYDSEVRRNVMPGELAFCQCTFRNFVPDRGDEMTPEIARLLGMPERPTDPDIQAGVGRKGLLLKGNRHEKK